MWEWLSATCDSFIQYTLQSQHFFSRSNFNPSQKLSIPLPPHSCALSCGDRMAKGKRSFFSFLSLVTSMKPAHQVKGRRRSLSLLSFHHQRLATSQVKTSAGIGQTSGSSGITRIYVTKCGKPAWHPHDGHPPIQWAEQCPRQWTWWCTVAPPWWFFSCNFW